MIVTAEHDNFLFVGHTAEYRIVKFDLQKGKIERIFSRKYKRRKNEKQEIKDPYSQGIRPPYYEYYFDILGMKTFRDSLWVMTSTPQNDKTRKQVDVFDLTGKFLRRLAKKLRERYFGVNSPDIRASHK